MQPCTVILNLHVSTFCVFVAYSFFCAILFSCVILIGYCWRSEIKVVIVIWYYAEAYNERRGQTFHLSACATQLRRTSQRWRAVGNTVSNLTDPGIEPQSYGTDNQVSTTKQPTIRTTFVVPIVRLL